MIGSFATGIEATRRIVERSPHVGVLVLTMFNDDDSGWLASAPLPLRISSGGLDSSLLDGLSRVPCAGARCAQPSGRVGALPPGGLAILEACCFVGAGGGIAGAVRMSAGARQRAAIDDQVFLAYRTTVKPALQ